jgi:hypothetical protein
MTKKKDTNLVWVESTKRRREQFNLVVSQSLKEPLWP